MPILGELRKRNVFRVGAAYLVGAWLLVQVAGTLFPVFGFDDAWTRAIVILLAAAFIPTLVFAWAFRLTPEGLRRESDLDRPLSVRAAKRLDRVIMLVLAIALGVFAVDQFVLDPQRLSAERARFATEIEAARLRGRSEALVESYGDRSIAVLPFVNMSDDSANEAFADGVSEELLNLLAKIPELRVISRSSAFSYKGKDVRLNQVAEELGVAHILEGSVRRAGDRVRITAQLIDTRTDSHLWSETFDRHLDDIFAVQEEIAATVVERLKIDLLGNLPRPRATDPAAYALYLEARFLSHKATADGYEEAIRLLERVLAIDPNYLEAWDALAGNYLNQAGKGLRPWDDGFERAETAARQALAIDAGFAPAYARLGWITLLRDNNLSLAARHYRRALELAPTNVRAMGDAASLLRSLGRIEECIALDEYVVARDPMNASAYYNLGGSYLFAGRLRDATTAYRSALQLSPKRVGAHYQVGIARLLGGAPAEALAELEREPLDLLKLLGRTMAYHALGEQDRADSLQSELVDAFEQDAAYNIATVMAFRGRTDAAFDWLHKAVAYGDPGLADVVADPLLASLQGDPRWLPFLASIGKAPAQLEAIAFEVDLPDATQRPHE